MSDLIRPFEGIDLDRCVSDAAERLGCPIASLTFELWYQPRPPADGRRESPPTLAPWLVVIDTFGPAPGRSVAFDDGRFLAALDDPAPEFWQAVYERALPESSDPWWALVRVRAHDGAVAATAAGEGGAR